MTVKIMEIEIVEKVDEISNLKMAFWVTRVKTGFCI